jgi:mannose-6-phosphate isomerase-like protein (cupin superfamily)
MQGHNINIEKATIDNVDFRRVLYTAKFMQLVLMSLKPGEDIGEEVHDVDQFFRFEKGAGRVVIDDNQYDVADGDSIIVPADSKHNVINTSEDQPLKLYTIYSPPHHKDGTVHSTKDQSLTDDEHFDGHTTE